MNKNLSTIERLGWKKYSQALAEISQLDPKQIARVTVESKSVYTLQSNQGELTGFLRGKKLYQQTATAELPKVGDWVKIEKLPSEKRAVIQEILPRKTKLSRKEKLDSTAEQVLVTNIDTTFIVQGLDDDFNLPRLERYLSIIKTGGSRAIIVLNKTDLVTNSKEYVARVTKLFPKITVLAVSAEKQLGMEKIVQCISPRETVVFVGSSGAGKSTIINWLLGDKVQETQAVRADDSRGRHTTTRRELFTLANGGIVIDTPGMREIGIGIIDSNSLDTAFADIKLLMSRCKFSKCDHNKTTGCAVKAALESGQLEEKRYQTFLKLQAELEREKRHKELAYARERKGKKRAISKAIRKSKKHHGKLGF